ncbi:hypothetical protein BSPA111_15030 [Buttiauxella sp. A111]|nr:hypothetical protein BSPA111_15030 [Buttiauxella sp. A111]
MTASFNRLKFLNSYNPSFLNMLLALGILNFPNQAYAIFYLENSQQGVILDSDSQYFVQHNITVTSNQATQSAVVIHDAPVNSPVVLLPLPTTFYNEGTINGPDGGNSLAGIDFATSGELQNGYSGSISGGEHGVKLTKGSHTLFNDGRITARTGNGISILDSVAYIENYQLISGGRTGIDGHSASQVDLYNYGTITAIEQQAVVVNSSSQIYNAGTLSSLNAAGILLEGDNNNLVLSDNSQIEGNNGVAMLSTGSGNSLLLKGSGQEDGSFLSDTAEHGLANIVSLEATNWTLSGDIEAYGTDNNVLDVEGQLTLAGNTSIAGGGGATVQKTGVLTLTHGGSLAGNLVNTGLVEVGGQALSETMMPAFTVKGDVNNAGEIAFNSPQLVYGNTLRIEGNYHGQENSVLSMRGALNGDSSAVDKLEITGDVSGSTNVEVTNIGGSGASTLEGIKLISVQGQSAENAFIQKGRIVAGSYDYRLQRGSVSSPQENSWYLSSASGVAQPPLPKPTPVAMPSAAPPVIPPVLAPATPAALPIGESGDNQNGEQPISIPEQAPQQQRQENIMRPEAGAYAANNAIANTLFVTSLQDRLPAGKENSALWLRQIGTHLQSETGDQLANSGNQYVAQLGADLVRFQAGERGAIHVGVMGGYGRSHGKSTSKITGYNADQSLNGYSGGLSATWFADETERSGAYSDNWLQYSSFKNSVKGDGLSAESYDSRGFSASTEWGYTFRYSTSANSAVTLQPQAQVVWMGVKADDHQEANGTTVKSTGKNNVATRLGLRTAYSASTQAILKPFVELNWLHNSRPFGVSMNDVITHIDGMKDTVEMKTGISAKLANHLEGAIEANLQKGRNGYQSAGGMLTLRYDF